MRYVMKIVAGLATVMILMAGMAQAAEQQTMDLPKSGQVDRLGTVTRVIDNKSFVFRDQWSDSSVDVHTTEAHELKKGQRVRIKGTAQTEALGIGREIVKASVTPLVDDVKGVGGPFEPAEPTEMQPKEKDKTKPMKQEKQ